MIASPDNKRLAVIAVAASLAGAGIGAFFILSKHTPTEAPVILEQVTNEPTPEQKAELKRRAEEEYAQRREAEQRQAMFHSMMMEKAFVGDKAGLAYMRQYMQNETDAKRSSAPPAEFRGYQFVGTYSVTGYVDEDGTRGDHFEGCDFGRVIVLNDTQSLTCTSYRYAYEYAPRAEVLRNGSDYVMIVNGVAYRMRSS